jgi:NitT/TauT family transport system substrate-binding protein
MSAGEVSINDRSERWSRREFVGGLTLAGTAGLPGTCLAPQYMADELLGAEGFTDVQYLASPEGASGVYERLGSGAVDITQWYVAPFIVAADKRAPILFLSGVHVGCQELVATGRIRSIRDLKGKTVVAPFGGALNSFAVVMLGYVGLDYRKDVNIVEKSAAEAVQLLAEGKVHAFLASAPLAQELRAKKIGHVIVDMAVDRPWAQYFCCMLVGNREFVRKHPVATKRTVRARSSRPIRSARSNRNGSPAPWSTAGSRRAMTMPSRR